jgi:hypothetical protein
LICRQLGLGIAVCLWILTFSACEYEVPITPSPTQKVQERLLGDWTSTDGKEKMKVRKLDDSVTSFTTMEICSALITPTSRRRRLPAFRTSTQMIASMPRWLGNCPMTASS